MKNIIIALALFLFIASSTYTVHAYKQMQDDPVWIHANDQVVLRRSVSTDTHQRLVPIGAFKGPYDVEEVMYVYEIAVSSGSQLTAFVENIQILQGEIDHGNDDQLVVPEIIIEVLEETSLKTALFGPYEAVEIYSVTVFIRLNMPQSEAAANRLRGSTIHFSMRFDAKP